MFRRSPKQVAAVLTILAVVGVLEGCGNLEAFKLLAPESNGFEKATNSLYIETGGSEETRQRLIADFTRAEKAIQAAYGSVESRPAVHACLSEACYGRFGGRGSRAKVYGGRLILISPRGSNWHYIAHEWSHAEMASRLTLAAWWKLPRWFDEGIAVAVSEAPEHSEDHWRFLVSTNIPRPTQAQLYAFQSLREWDDAVGRYGEKNNPERKAKGETEIRPVYSAAGHELRPWLAAVGSEGLRRLFAQLNAGADFGTIYVSRSDPMTW